MFVKPYGVVGQVEPVFCNIRDDDSVRAVMQGADAVVNCVGTFDAAGTNNFERGAGRGRDADRPDRRRAGGRANGAYFGHRCR